METVEIQFDAYLKRKLETKPNVLSFLLNHERRAVAIERTKEQIHIAEHSNFGKKFNAKHVKEMIETCAAAFANAALNYKEQQLLSELEKSRLVNEATKIERYEAEFEEDQKELINGKITSRPGGVAT